MTDITIPVDGQRIRGKLLTPPFTPERGAAVLFVHGWGATQRQDIGRAKMLVRLGFVCLTFNLRGHARTANQKDTVTRAQNLRDVIAAYDCLVSEPTVDPEQIGVVASSYGAYLAALLTAERKVRWLVLQAPALYKDDDFDRPKRELNLDGDLPAYRRTRLAAADNIALRSASRFDGDVLIVESENDTVIPPEVIANYRAAFTAARSATHTVIPDADHGLTGNTLRRAYGTLVTDWFRRMSGSRTDELASDHPRAAQR